MKLLNKIKELKNMDYDFMLRGALNLGLLGPTFFLGVTMILAMVMGGPFTVGTHALTIMEALFYGLSCITLSILGYGYINKGENK